MQKKYCIFSAQYLPHMGGVERYTYNLAKKLVERGEKVTIVTSNPESGRCHEVCEGIEIYRMPCYNLMEGRYPVLKAGAKFKKLNTSLFLKEFDFVIVNTRFYIHSIYGMRFAKRKNIPLITIEHGSGHLQFQHPVLDFMENIYEHAITGIGKLYCKDYYGVSEACNAWLMHFHIRAKGVLHNSIDPQEVTELVSSKKKDYRKILQIPSEAVVITFTGRLLKEKGIYQLVRAVKKICGEQKNVYLILAGDGPLETWVKEQRTMHIIPLGRLPYEEILSVLDITDIFCLPSVSEGLSTSILEAVACGCFVVTTKRGGAKELIINAEYGIIMENNQEEKVYQGLKRAVRDHEARKRGSVLAHARLEEEFTWDRLVERVCQIADEKIM